VGLSEQIRLRWDSYKEQSKIGSTQVEGLNFGETYAPIARLEAMRILLAYACAHNIKLYQMDVKSAFLMGISISLCMLSNLPVLKMRRNTTIFTS
jgi:hypothetical protein